jgi:hypothetical protein
MVDYGNASQRLVFRIAAIATLASMLAACGGGNAPQSTIPSGTNTAASHKHHPRDTATFVDLVDYQTSSLVQVYSGCSITCETTRTTLETGFNYPLTVGLDGANNAYVAGINGPTLVTKVPSGCKSASCEVALGGPGTGGNSIAVDSSGNAYLAIGDGVEAVPAGCQSTACVAHLGGGFSHAVGSVALDTYGNLYVSEAEGPGGSGVVEKMATNCTSASCVSSYYTGFQDPGAIAVDAAGDFAVYDAADNDIWLYPHPQGHVYFLRRAIGGNVDAINSMQFDFEGNLWVSDATDRELKIIPQSCSSASCVTEFTGNAGAGFAILAD